MTRLDDGARGEEDVAAIFGTDGEPAADPPDLPDPGGPIGDVTNTETGPAPDAASAVRFADLPDAAGLHRRHYLHLTRLAAMLVGDRETAEDIVQDVFAGMQKRWRRLSDPERVEAYLRAAVINGARTALRRRRTALRHQPAPPDTEPPAEETALEHLRDGSLRAAVAKLPPRQQEVILLRYLDDLTIAQTARVLGIGEGAVKSSAGRALARLANLLGASDEH